MSRRNKGKRASVSRGAKAASAPVIRAYGPDMLLGLTTDLAGEAPLDSTVLHRDTAAETLVGGGGDRSSAQTLPLAAEKLVVSKVMTSRGRVRVRSVTDTIEETVRETLAGEKVHVERVPIDQIVSKIPEMRIEAGVTIIPVVEEILVVEKRLLLKEELHIRREATSEDVEIPVSLRKQRAVVERLPIEDSESNPEE